MVKLWDINPSINGPIQRDRLWFSLAYRNWGVTNTAPITMNESTDGPVTVPGTTAVARSRRHLGCHRARDVAGVSEADNIAPAGGAEADARAFTGVRRRLARGRRRSTQFPGRDLSGPVEPCRRANLLVDAAYQHYRMENRGASTSTWRCRGWCYDSIMTPKTSPPRSTPFIEQTTGIRST